MKSFLPEGDLLTWEPRDDGSVRGFVASHPRVTLFIVTKQPPAAGAEMWQLTGAVMPDDEEKSSHSLETAKYHAEGYWRGWIDQMCVPHVSFLASPLLETLRDTAQQIHDATGQQLPAEAGRSAPNANTTNGCAAIARWWQLNCMEQGSAPSGFSTIKPNTDDVPTPAAPAQTKTSS